jgi:hypothetical protein
MVQKHHGWNGPITIRPILKMTIDDLFSLFYFDKSFRFVSIMVLLMLLYLRRNENCKRCAGSEEERKQSAERLINSHRDSKETIGLIPLGFLLPPVGKQTTHW